MSGWTLWDRPDGISSAFRCDGEKMSAHRDKRALHIIPEAVSPLPGIVTMELGQALRSYRESWAFIAPWSWSIAPYDMGKQKMRLFRISILSRSIG